jgi:hypothetical protein
MKTKLLSLFTIICLNAYSQQHSKITIDSGNKNLITVTQSGNNAVPESDIAINKGDSNQLQVNQTTLGKTEKTKNWLINIVTNTNKLFVLLISIATLIGLIYKALPYLRKKKRKKK